MQKFYEDRRRSTKKNSNENVQPPRGSHRKRRLKELYRHKGDLEYKGSV